MKAQTRSTRGRKESRKKVLAAAAVMSLLSGAVAATIGFNISPSVFTNDYVGKVTLSITNLTPGMTVQVDDYADLNTNGVIDAGDLEFTSFQVTDGQAPLISGVRNLNVPGDDDGLTNGRILVQYNYPDAGNGIWAGKFLFRVSDPTGNLAPATQAVSVAQHVYPQAITGRITFASTGLPLTNCPVGTLGYNSASHFSWTDPNGFYSLYSLPPGNVILGYNFHGAVFNGFLIAYVSCGQTTTNNLYLSSGTFVIAGRVTDSTTGAGVPNLQLDANTPDDFDVVGITDTNGNYALHVTTNEIWKLHPSTGTVAARGYVDQVRTFVTVSNASVSNINFTLSRPTALIYGTVQDTLGNPVMGVQLSTRNSAGNLHPVGLSFATNGSYSVGVQADTWTVTPNSADLALQGFTGLSSNVTLVAGQTTNINFVVTRTNWPLLQFSVRLSSNTFRFTLNGLAGQNYAIQRSTNLALNDWMAMLATNAPCNTVLIQDPQATNTARFYRAVIVP